MGLTEVPDHSEKRTLPECILTLEEKKSKTLGDQSKVANRRPVLGI